MVLAGCGGQANPNATTGAAGPTDATTQTATGPSNPWDAERLTVAVQTGAYTAPGYVSAVRRATAYWNDHRAASEYDVEFSFERNASNPDVLVQFEPNVTTCGVESGTEILGCAPVLGADDRTYELETVDIQTGYTDESTLETLKHEFGHLHGRLHEQAPMPLMNATSDADRLPVPDAQSVAYPWRTTNVSVAVEGDATEFEHEQVDAALGYFESGADGFFEAATPSFTRTQNASAADVVITVSDNRSACGDGYGGGSCGNVFGYSTDADDALEYYTDATITTASADEDSVAWHVGYWLALLVRRARRGVPRAAGRRERRPRRPLMGVTERANRRYRLTAGSRGVRAGRKSTSSL